MSDAYDMGYAAYERGDDIDMNPYDERDAQHDEWGDGYAQANFSGTEYDVGN
jgi:hypothetical protein